MDPRNPSGHKVKHMLHKCISVDGEAVEPLKECVAFSLKLLPPDKGGMLLSDLASIWSLDLEGRLRMSSRVQMNWVIAKWESA